MLQRKDCLHHLLERPIGLEGRAIDMAAHRERAIAIGSAEHFQ